MTKDAARESSAPPPPPAGPPAGPPARAYRHRAAVALFIIATVLLAAADLTVKHFAFRDVAANPVALERDANGQLPPIPPHPSRVLVPKLLALHLTVNEGAVFGLGEGGRWIFVAFTAVAAVVIITTFARSRPHSWILHLTLASILAGAVGNLYDRLVYGVVRDMLWLFPGVDLPFGLHWPDGSAGLYPWIFNVADVCLVVGLIALMAMMWRQDRQNSENGDGPQKGD